VTEGAGRTLTLSIADLRITLRSVDPTLRLGVDGAIDAFLVPCVSPHDSSSAPLRGAIAGPGSGHEFGVADCIGASPVTPDMAAAEAPGTAAPSGHPNRRLQISGSAGEVGTADLVLTARFGDPLVPGGGAERLFDSGSLWQLFRRSDGRLLYVFTSSAHRGPYKSALIDPERGTGEVVLSALDTTQPVYPLEYPLDELLLQQLLSRGLGAEVHGCGLIDPAGRGLLLLGQSGAGKTTTARLWERVPGARVLSDDRVIVREIDGARWLYGTPWHGEARLAAAARAPLSATFFLAKAPENILLPIAPTAAAARLYACSFLPFYDPAAIRFSLDFFDELAAQTPCWEFCFTPDERAVACVAQNVSRNGMAATCSSSS
jgi:hypothetical protein